MISLELALQREWSHFSFSCLLDRQLFFQSRFDSFLPEKIRQKKSPKQETRNKSPKVKRQKKMRSPLIMLIQIWREKTTSSQCYATRSFHRNAKKKPLEAKRSLYFKFCHKTDTLFFILEMKAHRKVAEIGFFQDLYMRCVWCGLIMTSRRFFVCLSA